MTCIFFIIRVYISSLGKHTAGDTNTCTYGKDTGTATRTKLRERPKQNEIYIYAPRSSTNLLRSPLSPPATAAREEDEHPLELKKTHRTLALRGVEVEEAVGGRPSTGAAPRLLQLLDLSSPATPPPPPPREGWLRSSQPLSSNPEACSVPLKKKETSSNIIWPR